MISWETIDGVVWVVDENNNRMSLHENFSEEEAIEALQSCTGCVNCINCVNCVDCSGCDDCSACHSCIACLDCHNCTDCTECAKCYDCETCRGCSFCDYCVECNISDGCTNCEQCWRCYDCNGLKGDADCSQNGLVAVDLDALVFPNIHSWIYEAASQPGALDMSSLHKCETTHCRAGWAVHLLGDAGYELEQRSSTIFAAMQIYRASGYEISPTKFYESEVEALADMKRLALQELSE